MLTVKVLAVQNNQIQITDGIKTMIVSREQLNNQIKAGKVEIQSLKIKCLDKQRDKNNDIVAYLLIDITGKQMAVTPQQLKQAIFNYQVNCVNLTLTSDGRLVDTSEYNNSNKLTFEQALQYIKDNNKLLDEDALNKLLEIAMNNKYSLTKFSSDVNHEYWSKCNIADYRDIIDTELPNVYLIHKSNTEHVILIPNNVKKLKDSSLEARWQGREYYIHDNIKKLKGTITFVGGKGLENFRRIFSELRARTLNLNYFNINLTDTKEEGTNSIFNGDIEDLFFNCRSKIITTDKMLLDAYNSEIKRVQKKREASKILYLLRIYTDDNNNKIYVIEDNNRCTSKYNINQLSKLLDDTYTLLNLCLTDDKSDVKYKNSNYSTNYALIGYSHRSYSIIDKRNGNKVDDSIIGKEPIDGVEINDGKVVTFMPVELSKYASNTSKIKGDLLGVQILDYDVIRFINHAILEFSDHGHKAESVMYAVVNDRECPSFGGSAGDDVGGLYNEAIKLKKKGKLTSDDIMAITCNLGEDYKNNRYFSIARKMESYYNSRTSAPDEFYDKILKLTALPKWAKPLIKDNLYTISG